MSSIDEDDGKSDFDRAQEVLIRKSTAGMRDQVVELLARYDAPRLTEMRYKDLAAFARECEALTPPEPPALPPPNAWAIGSAINDAKGIRRTARSVFGSSFREDGCALAVALKTHGLYIVPICTQPAPPVPTPQFAIGDRVTHDKRSAPVLTVTGYELRYILVQPNGMKFPYGVSAEKLKLAPPWTVTTPPKYAAPLAPMPPPIGPPEVPKFKIGQRVETGPEFGPLDGRVSSVHATFSYRLEGGPTQWHQDNLKPFSYF